MNTTSRAVKEGVRRMPVKKITPQCAITTRGNFDAFINLGIFTVPVNYKHGECLSLLVQDQKQVITDFNLAINDLNFVKPSYVLQPGDRIRARLYKERIEGKTTFHEQLAFLDGKKNTVHLGAQGLSLLWMKVRLLPLDCWCVSLDKQECLWKDSGGGGARLPGIFIFLYATSIHCRVDLLHFVSNKPTPRCFVWFQKIQSVTE